MVDLSDIIHLAASLQWVGGVVVPGAQSGWLRNPLCGDEVRLHVAVQGGVIGQIRHQSAGCQISQGCASLLCQQVEGRVVTEVLERSAELLLDFDYRTLTIHKQHCALLAYQLLRRMLAEQVQRDQSQETKGAADA